MSFHIESKLVPDFPARGHGFTLNAGDVIRVFDGPFGDATILGFNEAGDALVSRPYAYASCVGTTGPTPLLGTETYTLTPNNLRTMLDGFGAPRGNGRTTK